jgi:methylmalonyl-CoA mutase
MSDTASNGNQQGNEVKKPLFSDFPSATYEEWREAAEQTLKGASFEKKLITKTYEGIDLHPLYRQQDVEHLEFTRSLPGAAPYVRGAHVAGYLSKPWDISQEIPYATPEAFNKALRFDMERGQMVVNLVLDEAALAGLDPDQAAVGAVGNGGTSIASTGDMAAALEGINLEEMPILIRAAAISLPVAALLVAQMRQQGQSTEKLEGSVASDPLGVLVRRGTLPLSLERSYDEMAHLTTWATKHAPKLQTIAVHSYPYHNGGSNIVQELAFTLATAVDYVRAMQQRGLDIDVIAPHIGFEFSVGTQFFMEIAKLRTARLLWARIVEAFGGSAEAQKMAIHARTSDWNKTSYDPYVNMLRTTVEAFAGAMGGIESMHVAPFDEVLRESDEFSRRIARNTHLILQEECHFTKLIDPAGGSWYVESMTDQLAQHAWKLFQQVEGKGGMLQALQASFPQAEVASIAQKRADALATRKDVLVGTNMYPNLYEKPLEDRSPDYEALHKERSAAIAQARTQSTAPARGDLLQKLGNAADGESKVEAAIEAALAGSTLGEITKALREDDGTQPTIDTIVSHRGAGLFEKVRMASEEFMKRTGKRPQVFMANIGPIPQHKPRADFSTGFLEVGGFEMIKNNGFATADEAAKAAIESKAPMVVICSTDDTYADVVAPITKQVKEANPNAQVILAGYPADQIEAHKAAGVDEFIHLRANCYETLVRLQKKTGVVA